MACTITRHRFASNGWSVVWPAVYFCCCWICPESPGFLKHLAFEFDAADYRAIYVPPGMALGFQTLVGDTLIY